MCAVSLFTHPEEQVEKEQHVFDAAEAAASHGEAVTICK
jgi:hypothetical protein